MPGAIPRKDTNFFHAHCHSQFSVIDAISTVPLIVERAAKMGHPALALTDHGNLSGTVKLYQSAKQHGIKAFPGMEGYLIDPGRDDWAEPAKGAPAVERYHYGLLALDEEGYKALVRFSSLTHTRPRFSKYGRNTLGDLMQLGQESGDHLVLTTGCFFGLIQQHIAKGEPSLASRYVGMLSQAFPNLYVELQHHNIIHDEEEWVVETDDDIVNALVKIADEHGLPVIATQDSHYLEQSHQGAHTLMKKMVYAGSDDAFPGDTFHLATAEWVAEHYEQDVWDRVEDGFDSLVALHDLRITPLDKFIPRVPHVSDYADEEVWDECDEALTNYIRKRGKDGHKVDVRRYTDRLNHELDIIKQLNMSAYFIITGDMVSWCRKEKICVEARGSANGSLVCFLLGITQIDPLIWGGLFERFLSLDRIKPPDVDLDIEDAERHRLVNYLLNKYNAVQIGTYGLLGTRVDQDTGEEKGSIVQTYISSLRRECEKVAKKRNDELKARGEKGVGDVKAYAMGIFKRTYGNIETLDDIKQHSFADYKNLSTLKDLNSAYRSYGVHAGGILLPGPDVAIEDYIPTMLVASSDTRVSQYAMDDVEAFGLLKMDVLGQASLRMMRLCQEHMGLTDPTDFSWIPEDDKDACKLLREGRTRHGLFHFEGYTKAKGGKELGVKSTEDAVLVQALYMPGAMESGATADFLKRRKSKAERDQITYISPHFKQALERTYGTVVFQEQIIEVMRLLHLDIETINIFFKVVKDSGRGAVERNRDRMAAVRQKFTEACESEGVDADEAWDMLAGFASYGFNRAHASGYGVRSYRTAYLKAHFTTEFMAALLQTWAGRNKEPDYIKESRRLDIRLLPPDINISGETWTLDPTRDNAIRRGLVSIKGMGNASLLVAEGAPYASVNDLIERIPARQLTGGKAWLKDGTWNGKLKALHDAGALDSLLEDAELNYE